MKNAEFVALMTANTNKTKNLRTYGRKWFSGARRVRDCVLCRIGHVISLIQTNINQGKIINKDEESLLVYNFQPLPCEPNNSEMTSLYLTLDMMVRPMAVIDDTQTLDGTPIQLVVEAVSGEVMNNTKAMLQLGLIQENELEGHDPPMSYGCFKDSIAVCGFAALAATSATVHAGDIFTGKLDKTDLVQQCAAFDSIIEGRQYLKSKGFSDPWIVELTLPKELLYKVISEGLSKHALKAISKERTLVSPRHDCQAREANVEDEVHNLTLARSEPPTTGDEQVPHPRDTLLFITSNVSAPTPQSSVCSN